MSTDIPVHPFELLDLDALLDDEEMAIRDTVRAFVRDAVRPFIAEWFEAGRVPLRELGPQLGRLGLLGMHLDGYGCAGTSATSYGLACAELEAGDSGIRSFVSVQGSLAMFAIWQFGSDDQKQQWLPRMATGELIGCFALTEADAGSDPASMRTHARRKGNDWILDGSKLWITNGTVADVAIVWARTDAGIRGFVVPTDVRGFSARAIERKLSMRASVTAELVLDDVRLPGDAVLPGATGLRGPLSCLNEARFGITFGAVGAARDCLEAATDYALTRVQFGTPIAGFQLTQRKLASMAVELDKAALLAVHLGRLKDAGKLRPVQISVGKMSNCRTALEIARTARTIMGANGITLDYSPIRHASNLESVITYEGTEEVHLLTIGKALTGMAAFSPEDRAR